MCRDCVAYVLREAFGAYLNFTRSNHFHTSIEIYPFARSSLRSWFRTKEWIASFLIYPARGCKGDISEGLYMV